MENNIHLYIIQTGVISEKIHTEGEHVYLSSRIQDNNFVRFNYMGAAEYEWGASGRSFKRIMEEFDKYKLNKSRFKNANDVPFYIWCKPEDLHIIEDAIQKYLDHKIINGNRSWRAPDTTLKEPCHLKAHLLYDEYKSDVWSRQNNNFWWDFINDWIGFFAAEDRIKGFNLVMKNEYRRYTTIDVEHV